MEIPILGLEDIKNILKTKILSHQREYLAMYSSWYGGITKDPSFMMVPIDDHMVHRGDGVFEAFKCVKGNIYQLDAHFKRLENSMKKIDLIPPYPIEKIKEIVIETIRAGGEKDSLIRLYISRGPGDFSPKPEKSIGSQLYIVVTRLDPVDRRKREKGCSLKISKIPMKDPFFATIKSCNYLPNVLMKMECYRRGVDYVITIEKNGKIGEGATENFAIITSRDEFFIPPFKSILKGTTVSRALEFAREMVEKHILNHADFRDLFVEDLINAKEIFVLGTTMDILPITTFEDKPVGDGKPGKFYKLFYEMFMEDQTKNKELLTPVW